MSLIKNSRIFELLMQYSFGLLVCVFKREIFTSKMFSESSVSLPTPSCDASALEIPKRNKACIWKAAGIEVHLLLPRDLYQANKKHTNLLWWTVTPPSKCYMVSLRLWKTHSQKIHHTMALWQLGMFNVIYL